MNPTYPWTSRKRLETHSTCGRKYQLLYNNSTSNNREYNPQDVIQEVVQSTLSAYYLNNISGTEVNLDPLAPIDKPSFDLGKTFELAATQVLLSFGLREAISSDLIQLLKAYGHLQWRASRRCRDSTAIRYADKSVPKSLNYNPPKSYKQALEAEGIVESLRFYSDIIYELRPELDYSHHILNDLAIAYSLVYGYSTPPWAVQLAADLPFSTNEDNKVLLPGTETAIQGKAEWLVRAAGQLVCFRHELFNKPISRLAVQYDIDLNVAAYGLSSAFQHLPTALGIHYIPEELYYVVPLSRVAVGEAISYLKARHQALLNSSFSKSHPHTRNSPCQRIDSRTGQKTFECQFFQNCWPDCAESSNLWVWDSQEAWPLSNE